MDEVTRKRLSMRAWRRGMREMDLILGPFADDHLAAMDAPALAAFEVLLEENDQDLLAWVLGQRPAPDRFAAPIAAISAFARTRFALPPGNGATKG